MILTLTSTRTTFAIGSAFAILLAAGGARAAPALKIAVVLLSEGAGQDEARIEQALVAEARRLPDFAVVGSSGRSRAALELSADPVVQARHLGARLGAEWVLLVDVVRLADGEVVYLRALDVTSGRALASTTATVSGVGTVSGAAIGVADGDRRALRAALVRVLEPGRYTGRLELRLDVPGAEVVLDGKAMPGTNRAAKRLDLELPAGTHALRVTHTAYHDYVRFVDIEYGQKLELDVSLAAFPLAEGEMSEAARTARAAPVPPPKRTPWYGRWWVIGSASLLLAGAAATAVVVTRPGITSDNTVIYRPTFAP